MRTEKLFTIICVLLAFNVTESFGAASIRTTAVGASGSTTTASRAGALRTESVRNTNNLSSSVSMTPSTSAESGGRMASLPGGMPKVSKPNLPSAAYTANIDLSGIEARLDDLQTNKANVDDLDNFATRTELSDKADLSDLEDYATKDELEDKADASALTGLATKAELNAKADISRVYDKETVDAKLDGLGAVDADTVSSIVDGKLSPYSTTTQMNTAITNATSGLATTSALNAGLSGKANAGDVYTKGEVDTKLDNIEVGVDENAVGALIDTRLSPYSTTTQMNTAITNATNGLATTSALNTGLAGKADASAVYTKGEIDTKLDNIEVGVDENAVGALIDTRLTPYSTTAQMNTAITNATSGLATTSALNTGLAGKANAGDVYTKGEIDTALSGKADTSALNNYATKSALNTGLAGKADAGDVYTKGEIDTKLTTKADASALNAKLDSPSGGSAGQVLKLTSNGVAWGTVDAPSPNVQLTTFNGDNKLYYCTKTSGTCDTNDSTDNWTGVELSAIQGQDGQDGKDACQSFSFVKDDTYTGDDGVKYYIYCADN